MPYPEAFCRRMRGLLGEQYDRFMTEFSSPERVRALRVNTVKVTPEALLPLLPEAVFPVPYTPDGYYCTGEGWGGHPFHRAGLFYLQDPAAMSPVCAVPVQPGWRVLDLCASPGGKTAQLAAAVGATGFVVAGELNPTRCRTLGGNVERLGLRNTMVLNCDGVFTASLFPRLFDLVVTDAPCSGEGMFRKNPEAAAMWSEEVVRVSAARQKTLLEAAAGAVRPGGFLLYSTCTFAPEEDEEQIDAFLAAHPAFTLVKPSPALLPYTSPGVSFPGCRTPNIADARRFYPHICPGEGQFLAVLHRAEDGGEGDFAYRDASLPLTAEEARIAEAFLSDVLSERPPLTVRRAGDNLILLPQAFPVPPHCVFSAGVTLGQIQKGRLVPHHQFFSAYGNLFRRQLALSPEDSRTADYLRGLPVPAPELPDGWGCVLLGGGTLGGIKIVDGEAKNHYPKGLRG